jgi:EmrB/QacA subfamily drug resistance transporter
VSGPLLGGVLVEVGWEWIFLVNVPIGVVGMALVLRLVPDWQPRQSHNFDPFGIALFCCGLAAVVFGLQEGQRYDWGTVAGPVSIFGLIAAGLVLLVAFVWWQRRNRVEPLLPLRLFGFRNFSLSSLATAALGFALIGSILPLMLYLQELREYTALEAALVAAPLAFTSGATSAVVGRIAERLDARKIAGIGFLGYAGGLGLLAWLLHADTSPAILVVPLGVAGIGMGMVFAPLATLGTLGLPPPLVGAGSGMFNTFRQVGSVIGSAAVGVLLQARFEAELSPRPTSQAAFADAYTSVIQAAVLLPAGVLLLGVLACVAMARRAPADVEPAAAAQPGRLGPSG